MSRYIAVAVDKKEGVANLSSRFGASHYYLIVNPDTGEIVQEMPNTPDGFPKPLGTKEALKLKSCDVGKVISHQFGDMAYCMLDDQDIETWIVDEDLNPTEAVNQFAAGTLIKYRQITV